MLLYMLKLSKTCKDIYGWNIILGSTVVDRCGVADMLSLDAKDHLEDVQPYSRDTQEAKTTWIFTNFKGKIGMKPYMQETHVQYPSLYIDLYYIKWAVRCQNNRETKAELFPVVL